MSVNINTKMITLLGTPLGQSFAAQMQNAAFESADMDYLYFYTEVTPDNLGDVVKGLRYMNFAGFAVTKPNKVEVLQYLDDFDPLCKKMGSSNTVVRKEDGTLIGYNTDGVGFYRSLTEEGGVEAEGNVFYLIGAGGAGRAMASILAYHGAKKIYISDIIPASAESLVNDINTNFAPVAEVVAFGDFSKVGEAAVVMNATGIGMGSHIGETPMPVEYINKDQLYFDACYNPGRTQFLMNAEAAGAKVLNGLGMSLYQGAAQIELWTGQPAPLEAMRQKLIDIVTTGKK